MATVKKRGNSWQATVRGPDNRERTSSFRTKVEGEGWVADQVSAMRRGDWIDPAAGRVLFGDFARSWQAGQVHRASTAVLVDSHFRNHVFPTFAARPIASVRPSEVQAWVRGLADTLSPGSVRVTVQQTSAVFKAAVLDRLIAFNPCEGVKLPAAAKRQVSPLETEQVLALIDAMPDRYRALGALGAAAGLRQGEAVGVTLGELDFPRRQLSVRHQLVSLVGKPDHLAPRRRPRASGRSRCPTSSPSPSPATSSATSPGRGACSSLRRTARPSPATVSATSGGRQ